MEEIILRGFHNFIDRASGPIHFRFIIQPLVASLIGIRAGIHDANTKQPPFLWTLLTNKVSRSATWQKGFKDVRQVFIISLTLDFIYQVMINQGVYFLEMLFTAVILAIAPYLLIRGPTNLVIQWLRRRKKVVPL